MTSRIDNLTEKTRKRLEAYPRLKKCVEDYIKNEGVSPEPLCLTDLTVYIRDVGIDEPAVFYWDEETEEDFCSWGHNSRYANVLEPMMCQDLNWHIACLLDYLEEDDDFEEPEEQEE